MIHTFQVDLVKQSGRKWADDAEVTNCIACQSGTLDTKFLAITFSQWLWNNIFCIVAFSITNRKHHCRNCGQIFCSDCSSKQATMENYKKPQRVCESCFGELQQGKWHEFPHAGNASNRSEPNFYNDTVEQSPSANINHSQRSSRSSLWNEQVH